MSPTLCRIAVLQLNFKRAALLAQSHIQGARPLLSVAEVNRRESILIPRRLTTPLMSLGVGVRDIVAVCGSMGWVSSGLIRAQRLLAQSLARC